MSSSNGQEPVGRRKFLDYVIGGSFAATMLGVLGSVIQYIRPPETEDANASGPVEVASVVEIPVGTGKVLPLRNTSVIVVNEGERFVALSAVCPHANCVVEFNAAKKQLDCPCHGAVFDLQGNVLTGPPPRGLAVYRVEVQGDKIMVSGA